MYRYIAHGLNIGSEWRLPELTPASTENEADLSITSGSLDDDKSLDDAARASLRRFRGRSSKEASTPESPYHYATPDRVVLYWHEVGAFDVKSGAHITVDRNAGVEEDLMRLPLLGPVLSAALLQRRRLVLHASAVRVGDHAVAFVGNKGAGKSTMSAALHQKGYPVVTDDLLTVQQEDDRVHVHPAFPRFKLWPDAASAALNDDPGQLEPLHARVQKRARTARHGFSTQSLPLKRIYVLSRGGAIDVEELKGSRGLLDVLPHAYNNTLIDVIGSAPLRQWHFEACAALVRRVPIRILRRPRDLSCLHEVADAVIQDASE